MTERSKYAAAGRCGTCDMRVVRGFDDAGSLVNVDIFPTSSADEQLARARGLRSFVLAWKGVGMTIRSRTDEDVLLRPAGFRAGDRIVIEHRCRDGNA